MALTAASSAARVERELPHGVSLVRHPRGRRDLELHQEQRGTANSFSPTAPNASSWTRATPAPAAAGKQLRSTVAAPCQDAQRHLILLTATPHSGDKPRSQPAVLLDQRFRRCRGFMSVADPAAPGTGSPLRATPPQRDIAEWQARNPRRPRLCPPHENQRADLPPRW